MHGFTPYSCKHGHKLKGSTVMLYAKQLATLGVGLFVLGVVLHVALLIVARPASRLDFTYNPQERGTCSDVLKDIQLRTKVMTVSDTNILTAILANPYGTVCEVTTTLKIVDFDTDPNEHYASSILEPGETKNLEWVIKPKKPGNSDVLLIAGTTTKHLGIAVLDVGFSISWAIILDKFFMFVGPMWTLPWLYENVIKKRGRKRGHR